LNFAGARPTVQTRAPARRSLAERATTAGGCVLFAVASGAIMGCASSTRIPLSHFEFVHPSVRWVSRVDAHTLVFTPILLFLPPVIPVIRTGGYINSASVDCNRIEVTLKVSGVASCMEHALGPKHNEISVDLRSGKRVFSRSRKYDDADHGDAGSFTFDADGQDVYVEVDSPDGYRRRILLLRSAGNARVPSGPVGGSAVDALVFIMDGKYLVCIDGRKLVSSQSVGGSN